MEARSEKVTIDSIIKIEEWMFLILVGLIPILNLIVFTYLGFSRKINVNKRNFSRAVLIYVLIITALVILTTILI